MKTAIVTWLCFMRCSRICWSVKSWFHVGYHTEEQYSTTRRTIVWHSVIKVWRLNFLKLLLIQSRHFAKLLTRAYETSAGYQNEYPNPLLNLQMKQVYHQENGDRSSFSKSDEVQNFFDSLRTRSSIYTNHFGHLDPPEKDRHLPERWHLYPLLHRSQNILTKEWQITSSKSLTNKQNNTGPKQLSCGTPLKIGLSLESALQTITCWGRPIK